MSGPGPLPPMDAERAAGERVRIPYKLPPGVWLAAGGRVAWRRGRGGTGWRGRDGRGRREAARGPRGRRRERCRAVCGDGRRRSRQLPKGKRGLPFPPPPCGNEPCPRQSSGQAWKDGFQVVRRRRWRESTRRRGRGSRRGRLARRGRGRGALEKGRGRRRARRQCPRGLQPKEGKLGFRCHS